MTPHRSRGARGRAPSREGGIAIIAPMLTGKSALQDPEVVDSDGYAKHSELVAKYGSPSTPRDPAWWAAWNAARNHNLREGWSRRDRTQWILLVHGRTQADALALPVYGKVIIPEGEFRRRQDKHPDRAALARQNREQARQDPARPFANLEAAIAAAKKEIR